MLSPRSAIHLIGRPTLREAHSASAYSGYSEAALGWRWRNPRRPLMALVPENQVRTGLPAGGRRIRTIGPSRVESICLDTVLPPGAVEKACSEKHPTLGGPRVRILLPPAASLFSPVPSRATGSEPHALRRSAYGLGREKGTGRREPVLLGPFSLSGFDAVPLRENCSETASGPRRLPPGPAAHLRWRLACE
jgi:hypothetical protein